MEHSLEAYLSRRTNEELQVMLTDYCSSEECLERHIEVVWLILNELRKRFNEEDKEVPPNAQKAWERYLQHFEETASHYGE